MTSCKKRRSPGKRPPSQHRTTLAAYMANKRHLYVDAQRARFGHDPVVAKTVRLIAAETGMSVRTARYWLERDHFDEWFRWWPSFSAIVADVWEGRDMNAGSSAPLDLPDFNPADDDVR